MKTQRFIAVTSFGEHLGADPMKFVSQGQGLEVLSSLIKWDNLTYDQCVKTETINGKSMISFCEQLAYMFLDSVDRELCRFVFRKIDLMGKHF